MPDDALRGAETYRLLCVSHYFESHSGGIEMVAGNLARSLGERGLAVSWAASDASLAPTDIEAVGLRSSNLIERRSGLPFPIPMPSALSYLARAIKAADAVIVHDGMYPSSMASILLSKALGRPVVLVQHIGRAVGNSTFQRILFWAADHILTRPMLRLATAVVYISDTTARHFANVRLKRPAQLIFNGVDVEVFRPSGSNEERRADRSSLQWPHNKPVVLFVGRFIEKKGVLRLREMARVRPNIHWAFAGWGPCDPDEWNLPNVSVHRNLSHENLAPLYRAADVLALPSFSEGFPLVVQEALATGLATICCDDGATADPLATKYITAISNDGEETSIIQKYLAELDKVQPMGDSTEKRLDRSAFACSRYAWSATAGEYDKLIRQSFEKPLRPIKSELRND